MKMTWFHMQGYRDLPDDFPERYESIWVTPPNDEVCDPETVGKYLRWNLDEMELAASLGFDGVGTNEHHQNGYAFPVPNLPCFHLAKITKDVAIVMLGTTLPIHSPLRVAEELAQIDCLSGGRLVAGFPVGTPADVCHVYGLPPTMVRARYHEAHDFILDAWTRPGPFTWNGRFTQLRNVNPWPKPIQNPHPPVWLCGGGSVETWEMAAAKDYTYCFLSFGGHLLGGAMMKGFWEANDAAGNDDNPYRGGFAQIVLVADTDAEAERLYEKHVQNFTRKALHLAPQYGQTAGYSTKRSVQAAMKMQSGGSAFADAKNFKFDTWKAAVESGQVIGGSPETVREQLVDASKRLRIGHWILIMQLQSMDHELTNYNTTLFAEKVLPYVRDLWDDKWEDPYWPSGAKRPALPKSAAVVAGRS